MSRVVCILSKEDYQVFPIHFVILSGGVLHAGVEGSAFPAPGDTAHRQQVPPLRFATVGMTKCFLMIVRQAHRFGRDDRVHAS